MVCSLARLEVTVKPSPSSVVSVLPQLVKARPADATTTSRPIEVRNSRRSRTSGSPGSMWNVSSRGFPDP
ncbi:MAG: hypothetical protein IPK07_34655 [Deltaproteobacteria bacterium]|nr:hypothetical protein [Deltaproteobacteria bacterium]